MVKNHNLAKSINDASWYMFRVWLEYFGKVFGKITIAVMPNGTSQECSSCGAIVKKTLSTRTHVCACGCALDRDENAARNILSRGLSTVGHTGTLATPLATTGTPVACGGKPSKERWLGNPRNAVASRCQQRLGRGDLYFGWSNPNMSKLPHRFKNLSWL